MFITHKNNVVQNIADLEWMCRMAEKGMSSSEYWTWEETIKDSDGVPDYSGETGYTVVECTDEYIWERMSTLETKNYISLTTNGKVYNIKWQDDKGDAEEILDPEGESYDPKQYVQSHFVPDDTAKNKRILDQEWILIRAERDKLLTESDWTQANDSPLTDANVAKWKTYRTSLRDLPSDQSSKTKYSDITWPTKP